VDTTQTASYVQINPRKTKENGLHFLGFLWRNLDFSMSYSESKEKIPLQPQLAFRGVGRTSQARSPTPFFRRRTRQRRDVVRWMGKDISFRKAFALFFHDHARVKPFLWYCNTREGAPVSEVRKIAAILVADVVGYSRLAGADEDRTLSRLRALRSDLN
jgi:hypothetical protein